MEAARERLSASERIHRSIDLRDAPVSIRVDHLLRKSALARARWELDILASWRHQPSFYVDQTIDVFFHQLVLPPPIDRRHSPNRSDHGRRTQLGETGRPRSAVI